MPGLPSARITHARETRACARCLLPKYPRLKPAEPQASGAGLATRPGPLDTAFASANDDVNPRLTRGPAGSGIGVSANRMLALTFSRRPACRALTWYGVARAPREERSAS